ncbi:MAG: hypothetical protein QOI47_2250 [Actinomycetota bacterium]|nr:hypothetical protein [Actinomycetota bacterium]
MTSVETARARRQLVEQAGWRTTSFVSVLAGTLVAFGAVTLVATAVGATGSALGLDTHGISTHQWRQAGIASAMVGAVVLFGSFFFGGYTAGRMGRRAGARHGVLVFLLSVILVGAVAIIAWALRGNVNIDLNQNGVPTDSSTWADIGLGAGIAAAAAMLLGSIAGGIKGDRWHGQLATAVVERRDAERDEEMAKIMRQQRDIGDTPVDRTATLDLRGAESDVADPTDLSVEEERARS